MTDAINATLSKWGNSQGLRIPKEVCDMLGIEIGARATIEADPIAERIIVTFDKSTRIYQRTKQVSMEELCAGWIGEKVGTEWSGPDVGAEVVE